VVFQRLDDSSVWRAPLTGGQATRLGAGATIAVAAGPDSAGLCAAVPVGADGNEEELHCGALGAEGFRSQKVAYARYGFLETRAAPLGNSWAVAYQTEDDQPQVSVAAVRCE
jgi:hypothetical protein